MQYHHTPNRNFEDFASGRVFYALPGQPAFPVRLASEILQRCLLHWQKMGGTGLCTLYDPTCGGAYWLAVLAYLHWNRIAAIFASDMDAEVLALAKRNFALLTARGLGQRITEIKEMFIAYGKESHAGALESANRFKLQLQNHLKSHAIQTHVFQADGTESQAIQRGIGGSKIDIVLSDVPYGVHSSWQETADPGHENPVWKMLDALRPMLPPEAVIAIAADKRQKIQHDGYRRLERFQVGKRRIVVFRKADSQ
jgi:hypothetical protein